MQREAPVPVTSSEQMARQDIPFRMEGEGLGSQAVDALAMLALLLGVCLIAVWYARKRGWLSRWTMGTAQAGSSTQKTMRVEQVLRLSPKTIVYRVNDMEQRYLVVESTASARVIQLSAVDKTDV